MAAIQQQVRKHHQFMYHSQRNHSYLSTLRMGKKCNSNRSKDCSRRKTSLRRGKGQGEMSWTLASCLNSSNSIYGQRERCLSGGICIYSSNRTDEICCFRKRIVCWSGRSGSLSVSARRNSRTVMNIHSSQFNGSKSSNNRTSYDENDVIAKLLRYPGKSFDSNNCNNSLSLLSEYDVFLHEFDTIDQMIAVREVEMDNTIVNDEPKDGNLDDGNVSETQALSSNCVIIAEPEVLDETSLREVESQIEASLMDDDETSSKHDEKESKTLDQMTKDDTEKIVIAFMNDDNGNGETLEDPTNNDCGTGTVKVRTRRKNRRSSRRSKRMSMRKYGAFLKWLGDGSTLERDIGNAMDRLSIFLKENEHMTEEEREDALRNAARDVWKKTVQNSIENGDGNEKKMLEIVAPHVIRIIGMLSDDSQENSLLAEEGIGGVDRIIEVEEIAKTAGSATAYREVLKVAEFKSDIDACLRAITALGEECTNGDYRIAAAAIWRWTARHQIGSQEAITSMRKFEMLLSKALESKDKERDIDRLLAKCGVLCYLKADKLEEAEAFARQFSSCGNSRSKTPCATLFAPIIEQAPLKKALALFAELPTMKKENETMTKVIPAERAVAYQAVLLSCAVHGDGQSALDLYYQLKEERISASHATLSHVFSAFHRNKDMPMWRESCILFNTLLIETDQSIPSDSSLSIDMLEINLQTCGSCGEFEAAFASLATALSCKHFMPTLDILRSCLECCMTPREDDWETWFSKSDYKEECRNRLRTGVEIFKLYETYKVRTFTVLQS